jgi:glycosyltransferase involved in cell wall biosynthesis
MKYIFVIAHRIHFGKGSKAGGIDQILSFLSSKEKNYILIEHPLVGWGKSKVINFQNQIEYNIPFSGLFRWIIEYFFNLVSLLMYTRKIDFIISVDPLNFMSSVTYSFFTRKRVLLHLPDFSDSRFENRFLNFLYKLITRFACAYSTEIICVSKPMKALILNWGISENKVTLIPNSPTISKISPRIGPISSPPKIVFTKSQISEEESLFLLGIVKKLNKIHFSFSLSVVGKISQKFIEYFPSDIIFTGLINLNENFAILKESDIGLAIYLNPNSFEKYADSLKIREYAAMGLPVVSTAHISTALEGEAANCVLIASSEDGFVESISRLVENPLEHAEMSRNARLWAQSNDKDKILNDFFSQKFPIL